MQTIVVLMVVGTTRLFLRTCSAHRSILSRSFALRSRRPMEDPLLRRGGSSNTNQNLYHYILALGSNLGNRYETIVKALDLLCKDQVVSTGRSSFLYETAPMYITDQPTFLNAAIEVCTSLEPLELLERCKSIEQQLGRNLSGSVRNGPRPVDLDILVASSSNGTYVQHNTPDLIIPHPRIRERDFVLVPLMDILGETADIGSNETLIASLEAMESTTATTRDAIVRVLPLPNGRFLRFNRTLVMGILNVTPDSFSDGGKWSGEKEAVGRALEMQRQGVDIIDIGGESTRPGAREVQIEEELRRVIPVIRGIRQFESDVPISIDTRHAEVARAAVEAGADLVNDVSGGTFDKDMFPTVAKLQVPIVIMHMRGTPETMQTLTKYDDLLNDVSQELMVQSKKAEEVGIRRWSQVVDPGIGFAKDMNGNLMLLKNLRVLRQRMDDLPLLLGTSRKGFIGKLIGGSTKPDDRDPGSIASCITAICLGGGEGCNILRVHNVQDSRQAVKIMDAIVQVSH